MVEFVDTSVLVAALHKRDQNHEACLPLIKSIDEGRRPKAILHDLILAETLNFIVRKGGSPAARDALSRIESSSGFQVTRVTDEEFAAGKNEVFPSQDGLSFVDALTVAFMRRRGIKVIHTLDDDFEGLAGIRRSDPRKG